jgi:hypothetical protein
MNAENLNNFEKIFFVFEEEEERNRIFSLKNKEERLKQIVMNRF